MSTDEEIWALEELFWTQGSEFFRDRLGPCCLMVFPKPVGTLKQDAIVESLRDAPRWSSVRFLEQNASRPDEGTVTLGYEAQSEREGGPPYTALCSSTYRKYDGKWCLVQHQQTPI